MADNTVLNAGSGGDTVRDKDKGGVKTPICIIDLGGAGAESLLVSGQATMAASLPVAIASNQPALAVSAASLPLPLGASTEATLATLSGKVTACNTGAVTVATLPATPAGTNLIGQVSAAAQINTLYNGTTPVTVSRAAVNVSASGSSTLVAGVGGQKVYVLRWMLMVGGNTNLTVQDGSTPLTGALPMVANQSLSGAEGPLPHFVTSTGAALNLVSSAAVQVSGYLIYAQF